MTSNPARAAAVCALLATTWLASPASADLVPPKSYLTTPGGINVADGSLTYSVTDLAIGPLTLERFHRTGRRQPNDPDFGTNFSHNFDIYVAANPVNLGTDNRPIAHLGGSASGVYSQVKATLSSIAPANGDAERGYLEWSGGTNFSTGNYVYTDSSGTIYTFSRTVSAAGVPFYSQRVSEIVFPDGRKQNFVYVGGRLRRVEDSSGYALVLEYNGAGDINAACAFDRARTYVDGSTSCAGAALRTSYGYDSNGRLNSAVDAAGQATAYTNSADGITCITPPGFSSCQMSMALSNGRMGTQTLADGGTWSVYGDDPARLNDPDETPPQHGDNAVRVVDPAGVYVDLTFTKTSPYTMTDANGHVTEFRYTGGKLFHDTSNSADSHGTMLLEAILPEGQRYLAEYNGPYRGVTRERMLARPGSGLPDQERTLAYCGVPATRQNCARPAWIRDTAGNQTDFTYNARGQQLSEMQPAPTAGAARPLKLNTYVERYAYMLNAIGQLVPGPAPISIPATETLCQTVAGSSTPACDPAAPQTVTTVEYGPDGTANNLRPRGQVVSSGGQSRRTCFGYDATGNRISETAPRAGLTSCP
ncbi:MAG TPA: hypothetical protein VD887_07840 [Allosphingosinicella sp.]|nr:hypothetical protein [Allosphingosinicella sp.]